MSQQQNVSTANIMEHFIALIFRNFKDFDDKIILYRLEKLLQEIYTQPC